jgi:hypothetical protein
MVTVLVLIVAGLVVVVVLVLVGLAGTKSGRNRED